MAKKERKKTSQECIDELAKTYVDVFTGINGKIILADLEEACGQNKTSLNERAPDALQMAFCEGKRRVYLRIIGFMKKGKENGK